MLRIVLSTAGYEAFALGLAGRSGMRLRPPRILAGAAIGATLLASAVYGFQIAASFAIPANQLPELAARVAGSWLVQLSWVAILWIGLKASLQEGGSWAWRLVFVSGALAASLILLAAADNLVVASGATWALGYQWIFGIDSLRGVALFAGLLIGLRPAASEGAPPPDSGTGPEIATL
jgi:hypothetical protein